MNTRAPSFRTDSQRRLQNQQHQLTSEGPEGVSLSSPPHLPISPRAWAARRRYEDNLQTLMDNVDQLVAEGYLDPRCGDTAKAAYRRLDAAAVAHEARWVRRQNNFKYRGA